MKKTKERDFIDSELARTYFSSVSKVNIPLNGSTEKLSSPFTPRRIAAILSAFTTAGLAFFLAINIIGKLESRDHFTFASGRQRTALDRSHPPYLSALRNQKILYDFETGREGWGIPAWALKKPDYRQVSMIVSDDIASTGKKSLKINSVFPSGAWSASLAEIQHYLDLSNYEAIAVDIFIPPDAPRGLRAKMILTVGQQWDFIEMSRSVRLLPGRWITVLASLKEDSRDWKWTVVDEAFKKDVRKISLRIEYEGKNEYSGPVYIDNIRVGDLP